MQIRFAFDGGNIMSDILFKTDDYIFSYHVGGVLIHNGKVLMQNAEMIPPVDAQK